MSFEDDQAARQAAVEEQFWALIEATQIDVDQRMVEELDLGLPPRTAGRPFITPEQERTLREFLCRDDERDDPA